MRNIWITVSYEGSAYAGFQRQQNALTVQEVLEKVLQRLTGQRTVLYFVARTDAGVHAWGQECTFHTESSIPGSRFRMAMNTLLPPDIRVRVSRDMPLSFSVRKQNRGKTYVYLLTERHSPSPFLRRYTWACGLDFDIHNMKACAAVLEGTHDFTSLRGHNSVTSDPVRTINRIQIVPGEEIWRIYVTGSGFLYHMVRNMAGLLADAGRGLLDPKQLQTILEARDRTKLGPTAPAEGLCLLHVYFEEITEITVNQAEEEPVFPWNPGKTKRS